MSDKVVCISHHVIWHDFQGSVDRNSYILTAVHKKISKLSQKRDEVAILFPSIKQTYWDRCKNNVDVKFVFFS